MIIWQNHVGAFTGAHRHFDASFILIQRIATTTDIVVVDEVRGGSSDPALAEQLAANREEEYRDPMLRQKILREDEEVLSIIVAITERLH